MGDIVSVVEKFQRDIVSDELKKVNLNSQQQPQQLQQPFSAENKSVTTSNPQEMILALSAFNQAQYRSRFTTMCCFGGVAVGVLGQFVNAGSLPKKLAAYPASLIGNNLNIEFYCSICKKY